MSAMAGVLDYETSTQDSHLEVPYSPGTLSEFVTTSSGVRMPRMLYGASWNHALTKSMVKKAVRAGFRGFDTAGQLRHYRRGYTHTYEPGVGDALKSLFASGVHRDSLFIQTKVNPTYATEFLGTLTDVRRQVELSIANSLSNMGLDYLDSLVLSTPYPHYEQTLEAWRAMEAAVEAGLVRQLGISHVLSVKQLRKLYIDVNIKPAVVQQPFTADTGFEHEMRAWCSSVGIHFQSFYTLASNKRILDHALTKGLAKKYGVAPEALFFRFEMGLGLVPVTGTSSDEHMKEDLQARQVSLTAQDAKVIDELLIEELQQVSHPL
jgi:diketogulonate reductase-like aldo/keto reductase